MLYSSVNTPPLFPLTNRLNLTLDFESSVGLKVLIPTMLLPLVISLIVTCVYYARCIKILKHESERELRSTKVYIRNLKIYSFVQFIAYGPSILFLFLFVFQDVDLDPTVESYLEGISEGLAALTGFFNAAIFSCRGPTISKISFADQADLDLTQDFI